MGLVELRCAEFDAEILTFFQTLLHAWLEDLRLDSEQDNPFEANTARFFRICNGVEALAFAVNDH